MVTTLLPGLSSRNSAVLYVPPTTHSGWRYADAIDAQEIWNANVGDYIIDGPNVIIQRPGGLFQAIDMNPDFGNHNVPLGPGKKVIIKGGNYGYVKLETPYWIGADGNPVIITNYHGQINCGGFKTAIGFENTWGMAGQDYFRLTGKYDPVLKTGDPNFRGHDTGYGFSAGKYGIRCSMNWTTMEQFNLAIGGTNAVGMANHFEVDYIEVCDGGFGISLKWDSHPDTAMTYKFHDNYIHDAGGEGGYFGQNTNVRSHKMINCEVYNNRFCRLANEGLQMGNYSDGCNVHNNVFIMCGDRWKSPFNPFQDRAIQADSRQGEWFFQDNLVLGCGEYFIVLSEAQGVDTPPDNPTLGKNIKVRNNVFFGCRYEGAYIFPSNDTLTGYDIEDNWFGYFLRDTAPANLKYSAVYPGRAQGTRIIHNANTTMPISIKRNKYPSAMTLLDGASPNVTLGTGLDANVAVDNPVWPQFVNPGFEPDYYYLDFSMWSAKIGEDDRFPASGTNKGQNNVYNFGNWSMHKSVIYRSRIDNNFGHEPPAGTSDEFWELQLFNGGTRPPDDYRLKAEDVYNFLGVGLLDNPAPTTQAIPIDLILVDPVFFMPVIFDPQEIQIAVMDGLNNTVRFKIDFPETLLTAAPRIVGIGSSTMAGAGATSPAVGLPGLMAQWVNTNSADGVFYPIALSGTYSNMFVPDGTTAQSDWNRNIEAALALNPDIIIVSLPSNDPSFNTNAQFLANLKTIFARCQAANVYCFITTTQPRTEYSSALQQMLYDMAQTIKQEFKQFAVDVFTPLADPYSVQFPARTKDIYNADTIHVNNAGHQIITNAIIAAMQAVFVDKGYTKYQIFRSTSPNTGFNLWKDNVTQNDVSFTREDDQLYYYRVRAQRSDTTYTAYSNVVSLDQDLFAGDVVQTVQINFGNSTRPGPVVGWNTLLPSGDQPDAGEEFTNMKDTSGIATGIGVRITGSFAGVRSAGGRASEDYPIDVIRTSWRLDATTKAEIEFFGLDPDFLYTFKFLASFQNLGPYWFTGFVGGGRSAYVAANDPVLSSNDGTTADLISVRPNPDGTLKVKVKALPAATIGFMNTVKIYKLNENNAIPIDLTIFDPVILEPVVYRGGTANGVIQINLTGDIDSQLDDWNDVNANTTQTFVNLFTSALVNTGIGIRFVGIDNNRTDNETNYEGTTEFPTPVIRYGIYRSGNPPPQAILTNIKETKRLDFRILASRRDTDNVQSITIGGVTQQVNISNNKTNVLEFLNIEPDSNGEIAMTITYVSGPSLGYTYLTAMRVEVKEVNPSTPIILPLITVDPVFLDVRVVQDTVVIPLYLFNAVFFMPVVAEAGGNAAVLSTNQTYVNTERAMIYQPAGYNSNSESYPLIIYLHGAGKTINTILSEGIPLMLNSGDTLDSKFLVIAPGGPSGLDSWGQIVNGQMRPKHAFDYMVANYRVDPTRIYVTGLSLGAAGSFLFAVAFPAIPAAILAFSGSQAMDFNWAIIANIAVWSQHGTADTTQDRTNTGRVGRGMNAVNPKYPPLMSLYWNLGHSAGVWHDNGYRRKGSPVAGTKAKYDYTRWFLKYSKNAEREALGHVEYAEYTMQIEDYLQAVLVVNALPSSVFKTGLLGQLANIKATLFARMWVVDLGSSTYLSAAPINNITNINSGVSIANLTTYEGAASTVGFGIVNLFSTFQPQTVFPVDNQNRAASYGKYGGLDRNLWRDGARILTTITNGSCKFTGLNPAKQYKVVVLHLMDNLDDYASQSTISVTIGGVTQTQYSQLNTFYNLVFDNVAPVAGEITIAARCNANRDTAITGLILIEKP